MFSKFIELKLNRHLLSYGIFASSITFLFKLTELLDHWHHPCIENKLTLMLKLQFFNFQHWIIS